MENKNLVKDNNVEDDVFLFSVHTRARQERVKLEISIALNYLRAFAKKYPSYTVKKLIIELESRKNFMYTTNSR